MKNKTKIIMLSFLMVFLFTSKLVAIEFDLESKSAILMEHQTGDIVYGKNVHNKLPPASITKIMTMLLVMETLQEGEISLADVVVISDRAAEMGGSQIWLEPGEEMTVEELLKAIAIVSANDACVAIAEHIAGSEKRFVKMMNTRADKLGLENTYFYNTNGLPSNQAGQTGNYTTVHDVAVMARELLKHQAILNYTITWIDYLRDGDSFLRNTNDLLKSFDGADGLKTGFTNESGFCVAATAKREGMRFISVVMDAPNSKIRFKEAGQLLNHGFNIYDPIKVVEQGEIIKGIKIFKGKKEKISTLAADEIIIPVLKDEERKIKKEINFSKHTAPITKGDVVGEMIIRKNGKILDQIDIIAAEDVHKANFLLLMFYLLKSLVESMVVS